MNQPHLRDTQTSQALRDITEALGAIMPETSKSGIDVEIGKRIARFSNLDKPYSRTLIHLVRSGNKKPSPSFAHAVMAFAYSLDDMDPIRARSKPVQVNAAGKVQAGSIVLADSKPCAYPPCAIPFVPRVPWQIYHSPDCGIKNRKIIKRGGNK